MFTSNPFAELSAFISPAVMQTYVVVMILLVAGGTLFDIIHKRSAKYFFNQWQSVKSKGTRQLSGGEMASLAIQTVVVEGLASGEFCSMQRRVAHLLTMYGFLAYVITTLIMVFAYPTPATPAPAILPTLWYIGALMVCAGGYWFWFFIRADVASEGNSPFRLIRADRHRHVKLCRPHRCQAAVPIMRRQSPAAIAPSLRYGTDEVYFGRSDGVACRRCCRWRSGLRGNVVLIRAT